MGTQERRVKSVSEYRREILAIKEQWPNPALAFRGQERADWPLESSAERRLRNSLASEDGKVTDDLFVEYHKDTLLKKGKLRNYDRREGRHLDELELLADLQHHRAATCLVDFTRNALVSLWFACAEPDKDGKVFVANTADVIAFQEVTPTDMNDTAIEDILIRFDDKES